MTEGVETMSLRVRAVSTVLLLGVVTACSDEPLIPLGPASASRTAAVAPAARAKNPCAQVPVAALKAAFGLTFGVGTLDRSDPDSPECHWVAGQLEVSLYFLPLTTPNYDDDIAGSTRDVSYIRTSPRLGDDSVFMIDRKLPGVESFSVLYDRVEWVFLAAVVSKRASPQIKRSFIRLGTRLFA